MTYKTGLLINEILIYLAVLLGASLALRGTIHIFKKDFFNLRKTVLYLLNSAVFLLGAVFYVRLAIIVQGPKESTKEASMNLLKKDCIEIFFWCMCISILTTALLFGVNFLYQKYVIKEVKKSRLAFLALTFLFY